MKATVSKLGFVKEIKKEIYKEIFKILFTFS